MRPGERAEVVAPVAPRAQREAPITLTERPAGAVGGAAADLLVVEESDERMCRVGGGDDHSAVIAAWHETRSSRRADERSSSCAPATRGGREVEGRQIPPGDVIGLDVEQLGQVADEVARVLGRSLDAPDRLKVSLSIQLQSLFTDLAVEVDRELGDAQQGPIVVDQSQRTVDCRRRP